MILLGGIPNSGKTWLGKRIAEKDPKYVSLIPDALYDELEKDSVKFFRYFDLVYPDSMASLDIDPTRTDPLYLSKKRDEYRRSFRSEGEWIVLMEDLSDAYFVLQLASYNGKIPIVEYGILNNLQNMKFFFKRRSEMAKKLGIDIDFDSFKKKLIYLDLGLYFSLKILESPDNKKPGYIDQGFIRKIYRSQKIPQTDDFLNLEVIVLKSIEEVNEFADNFN